MIKNFVKKIVLNFKVIYKILISTLQKNRNNKSIEGIVFSMDRPIQLFSLLESYYKYCENAVPLYVIYKVSNHDFKKGYKEVEIYFRSKEVTFIEEKSFKEDLIATINIISSKYLFFLVDDIIFKSHFSFNDYLSLPNRDNYILSLRLGENLNYCYTRTLKQNLPQFKNVGKFISWDWRNGESDWNYVFSVDGNIYLKRDVLEMTKVIPFKAPNSYESNMNIFRFLLRRKKGLCYPKSVLVNVCLNRVQDEIENISGGISLKELNKNWKNNEKIDIEYFKDMNNESAHIEVKSLPLTFR